MKVIFHIDMNSFFASCHEAITPEFRGKPLVVSSPSRRAIVSTANYPAREFGINSAMPLYKAKELCKELIVVDHDFNLYVNFAQRLFDFICENYTTKIEVASIDECYIDVTEIYRKYQSAMNLAQDMQKRVFKELGLPNSIGISYNKSLAKIGSDFKKPMGITLIKREDVPKIIHPLAVTKLFGIGRQTASQLEKLEIYTIGDLAHYQDVDFLEKIIGNNAHSLIAKAQGKGSDELKYDNNGLKSIANETTLEYDLSDYEEIKEKIFLLAKHVCQRARKRTLIGNVIYVTLKYSNHQRHSKQIKLSTYTCDDDKVYSIAISLFEKLWNGEGIRLIGVGIKGIISKYDLKEQLSLNNFATASPLSETNKLINNLNKKYQKDLLMTGEKLEEMKYILQQQTKYIQSDSRTLDDTKKKRR
ncbi:DNA polymerase IV [Spiroplasma syrphidicola EA-1]|uniref:DNA polymerase IV n=1 Tax=Spiroplasma syrphidicola EA-1 TaxID=1276229 RepID=R4ULH1_9MOLU|nr:DNA polymerase IV [Spiroplasma syrphidicola]AGM26091.1 DNA polymerase IV [Spiroplasma syrphidicola EA-1]